MKKLAIIFTLFVCIISFGLINVGCEETFNYWIDTNTRFNEFLVNTVPLYKDGFDLGININTIIYNSENDADDELETYEDIKTVYEPVFKISFSYLSKFENVLGITPTTKNTKIRKMYNDFEKQIDDVCNELEYFKTSTLLKFTNGIEGIEKEKALSITSLDYLKNFKRSYINLSSKMLSLTKKFVDLYTMAYGDIQDFKDEEGEYLNLSEITLENYVRIATTKSIISTLTPYIDYINDFDGKYEKLSTDNFGETVNDYISIIENNPPIISTVKELENWSNTYKLYLADYDSYYQALNSVSMSDFQKYGYSINTYIEKTGNLNLYAHCNKIYSFSSSSITILLNKLNLLYV